MLHNMLPAFESLAISALTLLINLSLFVTYRLNVLEAVLKNLCKLLFSFFSSQQPETKSNLTWLANKNKRVNMYSMSK